MTDRIRIDDYPTGPEEAVAVIDAIEDGGLIRGGRTVRKCAELFFPAYHVRYRYIAESGMIRTKTENRTDTFLVAGVPGLDDMVSLQAYDDGPDGFHAVPFDDVGSEGIDRIADPVVFDHSVSSEEACGYLDDRIEEINAAVEEERHRAHREAQQARRRGDIEAAERHARRAEEYQGEDHVDELLDELAMPVSSLENIVSVVDATPVYLPFWVIAAEDGPSVEFVAFRSVKSRSVRAPKPNRVEWLSEFLANSGGAQDVFFGPEDRDPAGPAAPSPGASSGSTAGREADGRGAAGGATADREGQPSRDRGTDAETEASPDPDPEGPVSPPPATSLSAVAGREDLIARVREEVVEPLVDPAYERYNVGGAGGLLLYGPSGTGKSHVLEALAGELDYNYLTVRAAEIVEGGHLGEYVRVARAERPCLVVVKDVEALPEGVIDALEMAAETDDVVVAGTTTDRSAVSDRVVRAGGLDAAFEVPLPDGETRSAIFRAELAEGPPVAFPDPEGLRREFVAETEGLTAGDVVEVADRAKRLAVRESDEPVVGPGNVREAMEAVSDRQAEAATSEYTATVPDMDLSDVAGMEDLKGTLHEKVVDPLRHPERYEEYGLGVVNGVLLYGPPGTGKTHVSRALAGELDFNFIEVTASDVTSKYVGEASQNVNELFERALSIQPCLLFLDEIDAIAGERGGDMSQSEQQMVNELLTGLTKIQDEEVVVVATTNLPEAVDEALLRAGRFDEKIEVGPPDATARVAMVRHYLSGRPVAEETVDWDRIARITEADAQDNRFVAADIERIVTEAARRAMADGGEGRQPITRRHLEAAAESAESSLR